MIVKVALLTFCLVFTSFAYAEGEDIIACIDDHPPYQFVGNPPHGTHVSALKVLAQILDKKLVFVQSTNFARCVAMLKNGDVDVIAGLNINDERKSFAFYAPFKIEDDLIVITQKGVNISEYNDFYGKIIGVPRGTTYFKKFDHDPLLNKVSIHNERTGLTLLLKKRIDVLITSPYVAKTLLTDSTKEQIKTSPLLGVKDFNRTFFGFSKRHKLNLSEEEIVSITTQAFKQGEFKVSHSI